MSDGLQKDEIRERFCGVCAGQLVNIRPRHPHVLTLREVCPTCLAERMDQIREVASPDYGRAYEAKAREQ